MRRSAALLLGVLLMPAAVFAAPAIEARGLMRDMAVIVIDGQQQLMRVGDRFGEVELVSATPEAALLRVGDQEVMLGLSQRVGANFAEPERREVRINRDGQGHFRVAGTIEGQNVAFLVDTGATVLAMSSERADRLGIDYESASQRSQVVTASGPAASYYVELAVVEVGGIRVRGVQAAIVEGAYPSDILLGMSFLNNVGFAERAGVLTLTQEF